MVMAKTKYVFFNGEIVPHDEAKVHVSTTAFKFGAAVFEGVRGYWNERQEQLYLFRMPEHMQRLEFSQRVMRFDEIIDADYVTGKAIELIRANEVRETLHMVLTVFVNGRGGPETRGPVALSITANPGFTRGFVQTGCSVQVSSWQRVPDNAMPVRVKCNANYQNGRLAAVQARSDGYDTALLLNSRGKVSEGPGQCFFMIRDGKAITPSTSPGHHPHAPAALLRGGGGGTRRGPQRARGRRRGILLRHGLGGDAHPRHRSAAGRLRHHRSRRHPAQGSVLPGHERRGRRLPRVADAGLRDLTCERSARRSSPTCPGGKRSSAPRMSPHR